MLTSTLTQNSTARQVQTHTRTAEGRGWVIADQVTRAYASPSIAEQAGRIAVREHLAELERLADS
jgi:hypothetical protein